MQRYTDIQAWFGTYQEVIFLKFFRKSFGVIKKSCIFAFPNDESLGKANKIIDKTEKLYKQKYRKQIKIEKR